MSGSNTNELIVLLKKTNESLSTLNSNFESYCQYLELEATNVLELISQYLKAYTSMQESLQRVHHFEKCIKEFSAKKDILQKKIFNLEEEIKKMDSDSAQSLLMIKETVDEEVRRHRIREFLELKSKFNCLHVEIFELFIQFEFADYMVLINSDNLESCRVEYDVSHSRVDELILAISSRDSFFCVGIVNYHVDFIKGGDVSFYTSSFLSSFDFEINEIRNEISRIIIQYPNVADVVTEYFLNFYQAFHALTIFNENKIRQIFKKTKFEAYNVGCAILSSSIEFCTSLEEKFMSEVNEYEKLNIDQCEGAVAQFKKFLLRNNKEILEIYFELLETELKVANIEIYSGNLVLLGSLETFNLALEAHYNLRERFKKEKILFCLEMKSVIETLGGVFEDVRNRIASLEGNFVLFSTQVVDFRKQCFSRINNGCGCECILIELYKFNSQATELMGKFMLNMFCLIRSMSLKEIYFNKLDEAKGKGKSYSDFIESEKQTKRCLEFLTNERFKICTGVQAITFEQEEDFNCMNASFDRVYTKSERKIQSLM